MLEILDEWIKIISSIIILLILFGLSVFCIIKIWQCLKEDKKKEKECIEIIRLYTHMFLRNDLYSMPKKEVLEILKGVKAYLLRRKMIPKELEDPFKNCDCEQIYYIDFDKEEDK